MPSARATTVALLFLRTALADGAAVVVVGRAVIENPVDVAIQFGVEQKQSGQMIEKGLRVVGWR
jgi:hypothetical protein